MFWSECCRAEIRLLLYTLFMQFQMFRYNNSSSSNNIGHIKSRPRFTSCILCVYMHLGWLWCGCQPICWGKDVKSWDYHGLVKAGVVLSWKALTVWGNYLSIAAFCWTCESIRTCVCVCVRQRKWQWVWSGVFMLLHIRRSVFKLCQSAHGQDEWRLCRPIDCPLLGPALLMPRLFLWHIHMQPFLSFQYVLDS